MSSVSMGSYDYASSIVVNSQRAQNIALLNLFEVVKQAAVAQTTPLANLANTPQNVVDVYA